MKEVTKMSRLTGQLEKLYNGLNADFFDGVLVQPVITIQPTPKAYGHYSLYNAWNVNGEGKREINIDAGTLHRPLENLVATMVHEMCHQYNDQVLHQKDCSGSGNYYHNKVFKKAAEDHGLIVSRTKYGWNHTEPSDKLIEWILENNIQDIKLTRAESSEWAVKGCSAGAAEKVTAVPDEEPEKKKSNVRRYVCPSCGMIARATKAVNIGCWDCMVKMVEKEGK